MWRWLSVHAPVHQRPELGDESERRDDFVDFMPLDVAAVVVGDLDASTRPSPYMALT